MIDLKCNKYKLKCISATIKHKYTNSNNKCKNTYKKLKWRIESRKLVSALTKQSNKLEKA